MTLVVGLGNPGTKYEKTRHNLGFMVVDGLAEKLGAPFKKGWRLKGYLAEGHISETKLYILKPTTYMNLSGKAVRNVADFYKIPPDRVLIVVDDVYLKLGKMRLRPSGSAGGHNGLKSVQASLQTENYPRLRMGVGPHEGEIPNGRDSFLEEFVLARFTTQEHALLPQVVDRGVGVIEAWIGQDFEAASQLAGNLSKEPFVR